MMAAHLYIPSLDSTPNQPSTLSRSIVQGILRDELGFEGLVFTDAMTMKGFTSFTQTSTPHTDALLAGNDVLLFPGDPAATLDEIEGQVCAGRLDSVLIADKCRRVLAAKSWTQAAQSPKGQWDSNAAEALHRQVISKALTAVKNDAPGLPFGAHVRRVEQVFVGFDPGEMETSGRLIQSILGSNAEVNGAALTKEAFETAGMSQLDEALSSEPDLVVLHIGGTSHRSAKGHGESDAAIEKIANALRRRTSATCRLHWLSTAVLTCSIACPRPSP